MSLPLRRRALFFFALTALASWGALGGCSTDACPGYDGTIKTRADSDADFSTYHTFAVREIDASGTAGAGGAGVDIPPDVKVNLQTANDAAVAQLEELGLDQVDPDETPDLWVFSAAATDVEQGVYWYCVPEYYWWGFYYYWDPCAWMTPIEFDYTVGTLLVGVADAETEQPVFGGLVQGVLECVPNIEDSIETSVAAIFEDYPTEEE